MKIAYYCQHVLGVGHFHRSLEICKSFSERHQVTMIVGGAPLEIREPGVSFFQLPGMMMDSTFHNLAPCDTGKSLEETKTQRQKKLYRFFEMNRPDVFLVELYPFGRKAFRFELDPILKDLKKGKLPPCITLCSLRDILVQRSDSLKFEQRIITTLNSLFDGLLLHGEKNFIPLENTFSRVDDIEIPSVYTGYVTRNVKKMPRTSREELGIGKEKKLIIASIGGGNVGSELLKGVIAAYALLSNHPLFLQIFTGPYASDELLCQLQRSAGGNIRVDRFSPDFPDWLGVADLSVSMAGYNTCMNVLAAGTPALLYPFSRNQEQYMRVKKLEKLVPVKMLKPKDLSPERLAHLILRYLKEKRYSSPLDLDGADRTVTLVEEWSQLHGKKYE